MNKKVLFTIIIIFVLAVLTIGLVIFLADHNYLFVGNVWRNTPEEALLQEADNTVDAELTLTVKTLLHKRQIDDITVMTFVSKNDTLTTVTFVTNDDGLFSVYGYTEETFLSAPTEFVLTGDENQYVLFPYDTYNTTIYGWCYSTAHPIVNGLIPLTQTYEFECQGKTWSLKFWWIDDFPVNTDIVIEFETN